MVVRDLLTVQKAAPVIASSHIVTHALRLKTANHASIAFGGGSAWVLSPTGTQATSPCGKLLRVNASSVTVTGSVPIRLCPAAVAYGDGGMYVAADGPSLWALSSAPPDTPASGLVAEINPANGAMTRRVSLPAPGYQTPDTIGVYQRHAWVINDFLGTLTRIAP
jgi:hypothetical protein